MVGDIVPKDNGLPIIHTDNIDERVAENLRRLFVDRDAFAENTWQQMLSVLRSWARWCDARYKTWIPADPEDVRQYLFYLKEELNRSTNTVNQHQAMINKIHRHAGLPKPSDHMAVSLGMKRIRRRAIVNGERISQAIPLHIEQLLQVAELWEGSESLKHRRNLAFIGVAYNTLLRIAEISRLRVADVRFAPDGSATVDVGYTKTITDQYGVVKKLSPLVATWLKDWIAVAGIEDYPEALIFCKVGRYNTATMTQKTMTHKSIEGMFADAWSALYGEPPEAGRYKTWTGHSARVGAAQDMAEGDVSLPQIMHEGTWKRPEQVLNYIRYIDADKSAMLDIVKGVKKKK